MYIFYSHSVLILLNVLIYFFMLILDKDFARKYIFVTFFLICFDAIYLSYSISTLKVDSGF